MIKFDVLTIFPDMFEAVLGDSITGRARNNGLIEMNFINIRDYTKDKHKRTDDYPYSGGGGMLMTPQPICARVHTQLRGENLRKIAGELVKIFNEGIFDSYMQQMRDVAKEEEVPLCDVYARWMTLYHSGVDITDLLANYLNHPTRDMHWAFAVSLAEIVFA